MFVESKSDYSNEVRLATENCDFWFQKRRRSRKSYWLKVFANRNVFHRKIIIFQHFLFVIFGLRWFHCRTLFFDRSRSNIDGTNLARWKNRRMEGKQGWLQKERRGEAKTRLNTFFTLLSWVRPTEIWWHRWKFLSTAHNFSHQRHGWREAGENKMFI